MVGDDRQIHIPSSALYSKYLTCVQASLKSHYRVHTPDAVKCSICDFVTVSQSSLIIHKRVHQAEKLSN